MSREEKIEILVLLSGDQDEETRNTAFYTLQTWNTEELQQVLSDPATSIAVLDFAANHLIRRRGELREAVLQNPALPNDLREWIENTVNGALAASLTAAPTPAGPSAESPGAEQAGVGDRERETLLQKIARMTAAEKITLALKGNQEERLLLIRDPNKIVARAVLQSPKLTEAEVEAYATMKNVSEEVLRLISINRSFMKNYSVVRALVNNPRAPIDITLPLLCRLNDRDLKGLAFNKNVAEVLRTMATKLIKQKQEAQKVKIPAKH